MLTGMARLIVATCTSALLATGCSDDATGNENSTHEGALISTAPASAERAAVRGRDRLQQRNPHDWVGTAHNKMIDDFRREVRKAGLLTRDICGYVIMFGMSNERLPVGKTFPEGANWQALQAVSDSSTLCGSKRRTRASNISFRSRLKAPSTFVAPQSSTAYSLMDAVEVAVNNATDANNLASRLNAILDQAATLSTLDQDAIAVTVSVAQNSFEYWQDQYPSFEYEIIAEYTPCVEEQLSYGYNDPVDTCTSGKGSGAALTFRDPLEGNRAVPVRLRRRTMCGPGLAAGFKKIAVADAKGAFIGFFGGALSGGPGAGVLAAIAAGGGNSIWAAGENAWQTLKCIYGLH